MRLAVRARSTGVRASAVDAALADRSLVVGWLNRGTLHLVAAEDYWMLHALTTPQLRTSNTTRLRQEGVTAADAGRALRLLRTALADGAVPRAGLTEQLASAGLPTAGQAVPHLLLLASIEGLLLRGPVVDGEQAYVPAAEWIGPPPVIDREAALTQLAGRYLAGHGPADERDLAKWAGIGVRDSRRALAALGPAVEQRPDGLVGLGRRPAADAEPPPRLLGVFDPVLLGWVDRAALLAPYESEVLVGGIMRAFALVEGRAAATWTMPDGRVRLEPLRALPDADRRALDADADAVAEFLRG